MSQKNYKMLSLLKMGELALVGAMIFQEVLARNIRTIPSLTSLYPQPSIKQALLDAWDEILKINYVPVFKVGIEILKTIPSAPGVEEALRILAREAEKIASSRAILSHDLMGRIYHTLLMRDIAKFFATYYTSVIAAQLLARFALDAPNEQWKIAWEDPQSIANFKVIDIAVGTGTLIKAIYKGISDKHIITSAERGLDPQLDKLHQILLEKVLWGLEVLTYAAHLTATALALHNPAATFSSLNIYVLPLTAKGDKRLGSIDLLVSNELPTAISLTREFIAPAERKGIDKTEYVSLKLPTDFDIIIMNPPFTRSVGGNLLFGALPPAERRSLQDHLQKIIKAKGLSGIIPAGLGAVFIAVADRYLKEGGRLAIVIPRRLLTGVAWQKIRELLVDNYEIELIITSHQAPKSWNFSENTDLSEVLLVARKLSPDEEPKRGIIANLWLKPENELEALILCQRLIDLNKTLASHTSHYDALENPHASYHELKLGEEKKMGEAYAVTPSALREAIDTWGQLCPFAQTSLNRIAYLFITTGRFSPAQASFPLINLGDVVDKFGPERPQVHSVYTVSPAPSEFKAFWGHDSEYVSKISLSPNSFLSPKPGAMSQAQNLWASGCGKLMIADRLRLNTNKLFAVYLSKEALSNVWRPIRLKESETSDKHIITREEHEQVQALWLNTAFGLLGILSLRQDTQGAWVEMKKEILHLVPLLDISRLTKKQVKELLDLYEKMSVIDLPSFPVQFEQASKKQGWRYEVDKAVMEIVTGNYKDLSFLYEMLAREPIVCLKPLV